MALISLYAVYRKVRKWEKDFVKIKKPLHGKNHFRGVVYFRRVRLGEFCVEGLPFPRERAIRPVP